MLHLHIHSSSTDYAHRRWPRRLSVFGSTSSSICCIAIIVDSHQFLGLGCMRYFDDYRQCPSTRYLKERARRVADAYVEKELHIGIVHWV